MIVEPVTLTPDAPVREALAVMERYHISGVPITETDGKLVGILTNRDLRFIDDIDQPIGDVMTNENLITAPAGTTLDEAAADPAPPPGRKAAGRGRARLPDRSDHGQGHPEEDPVPERDQGRPGPLARRRGGRRRRRRRGARGRRSSTTGVDLLVVDTAHGHSRSRAADGATLKSRYDVPSHGRQRRHRRRHRGADRRRRRRA